MVVGIVGLGLMGGSLGLALQNTKLVSKIVGFDHNLSHCEEAFKLGLVHDIVSFAEIKTCDMIFLAIPVGGIIKALQELQNIPTNTTIVDMGSTKAEMYYANISKMENKGLFLIQEKFKNIRNVLTGQQLQVLCSADQIVIKAIKEGMSKNMNYKDIYVLAPK